AAALGLLTALGVTGALLFWPGEDDPGGMTDGGDPTERGGPAAVADGEPLTVGPDGRFPTIAAALNHLRELPEPAGPDEAHVILLPKGAVTERLVADGGGFDFPSYVTLRGHDEGTTFRTAGAAPSVTVTGPLIGFTLENVAVDASGKAVAVELSGGLTKTRFAGLSIDKATGTGLLLRGVASDGLRIEKLRIESAGGSGTRGVQIAGGGATDTAIAGGSIAGPEIGVEVGAMAERLTLDGLSLSGGRVGVQFGRTSGGKVSLKEVTLSGLRFADLADGVSFANAPTESSKDLVVSNSDFGNAERPIAPGDHAAAVESALDKEASVGNQATNTEPDPLNLFP
ncbi:MAG: hypothetical protein AAF907_04950, partial [Planctomycetota bacterium]